MSLARAAWAMLARCIPLLAAMLLQGGLVAGAAAQGPSALLSEGETAWLRQYGPIRVGYSATERAPLDVLGPAGEHHGMTADFLKLLQARLALQLDIKRYANNAALLDALRKGSIDMAGSLISTPDREAYLDFSPSYARNPRVLIARKGDNTITRLSDVTAGTVALERGRGGVELLRREFPGVKMIETESAAEALRAVAAGQARAFVGGLLVTSWAMEKEQLGTLEIKAEGGLTDTSIRFATRKTLPQLAGIIMKGVGSLTDEERETIQRRWTVFRSVTKAEAFRVELTLGEQVWMRNHPILRVGVRADRSPLEFIEKDGKFSGIAADYVKLLEDRLGIEFTPVLVNDRKALADGLKSRDLDVVALTVPNTERTGYLLLTRPMMSMPWVIVTRTDVALVQSLNDLTSQTVAVVENNAAHLLLRESYPGVRALAVDGDDEGLNAVVDRRAVAMVAPLALMMQRIQDRFAPNLRIVSAVPKLSGDFSMGVRSDWPEMVSILNKGLASIDDADHLAIRNKWLNARYSFGSGGHETSRMLLAFGIVTIIILGVILAWNHRLQIQMGSRQQLEDTLRDARAAAAAAHRTQAELLAAMAREAGTLVTGMSRLAKAADGADVEAALDGGRRLVRWIDGARDLSALEAGITALHPETLALQDMLDGACAEVRPAAEAKRVTLTPTVTPAGARVTLDPACLRRLLHCLLSHAVASAACGGVVECAADLSDRALLRLRLRERGPAAASQGPFVPFAPSRPSPGDAPGQDEAPGLTLARWLVERQGGTLSAGGGPGQVSITLPCGTPPGSVAGRPA